MCDWRTTGLRFFPYGYYLRQRFGARVHKVSVDAGFTCPNVDGTLSERGCIFCNNRSFSPSRRQFPQGIGRQIEEGLRRVRARHACDHVIAYFQPSTNTYAPMARLREVFEQAMAHPSVVGLAVGTRPDCASEEVLDLLAELATRTFVSLEYGMQTMHERSLDWLNRGHHHAALVDAVQRSRGRGLALCAHLILGIPGETGDDMLATAREVTRLGLDAVKIHNLYVVKDTVLAVRFTAGQIPVLDRDDYVRTVVDFLERLPSRVVVERLSGDAPPEFLIAPAWCLDKQAVRAAIEAELARRDSWQGKLCPCIGSA